MYKRAMKRQRGLTLIELMIVVVITGILTMIAYPGYTSYVVKSKRVQATSCLQEAAQYMERFYTTNLRYDQTSGGAAVTLPTTACVDDMRGNYVLSLPSVAANSFVVRATPQGNQAASDTACGALSLSQSGAKTISGTGTLYTCWQ